MMCEPPIDELAAKTEDNKYILSCLIAKRAKELEKKIPAELAVSDKKSITLAAEEVYDGKVVASHVESN
ncbi:MAG: DNA-directed RNA polymerase subunit omega [Clostridia bacterium]